jgi:hypothetical protein
MKPAEFDKVCNTPNTRGEFKVEISRFYFSKTKDRTVTIPFRIEKKDWGIMMYCSNPNGIDIEPRWNNHAPRLVVESGGVYFDRPLNCNQITLLWRHTIINP